MTTTRPATPAPPSGAAQRVSLARVVRSEWTKLRSQPSTAWSLLITVVSIVGFGVLYCLLRVARPPADPAALATFDPTAVSLTGVQLAQIAVGVLGVLLVAGEYATGLIRTSFTAVPRRLPVLWGKAITFALTTLAVCLPVTLIAFLVGQSVLSEKRLDIALTEPGVARAVLGSALYLSAVGLLGLGLGALLRSTAGAVAALLGLLFGPQLLVGLLPSAWSDQLYRYLPVPAGAAVANVRPDPVILSPWRGFGLFCLYTGWCWRWRRGRWPAVTPEARRGRSGDLLELAGVHVVDEAAHRVLVGHEGAGLDAGDRLADVTLQVGERLQGEVGPQPGVGLDVGLHLVVGEGQHAAVGVVDEDDLAGPEQALGDDQGAERVVGDHAAGVADDVGLALAEPQQGVHVEAGVHAGDHGQALARGHGQVALLEGAGELGVVAEQLVGDRHGSSLRLDGVGGDRPGSGALGYLGSRVPGQPQVTTRP